MGGRPRAGRPARFACPPGGWTAFWVLGLVLGLVLYQNLAFAGWRAVLLLPPAALAWRARVVVRTP